MFFFFKQKTAYEMRISDWSSDVCSSDLVQKRIADRREFPIDHRRKPNREVGRDQGVGKSIVAVNDADARHLGCVGAQPCDDRFLVGQGAIAIVFGLGIAGMLVQPAIHLTIEKTLGLAVTLQTDRKSTRLNS